MNFGFPQEQESRLSPTAKLLVKMKGFPESKRTMHDAVIVELCGESHHFLCCRISFVVGSHIEISFSVQEDSITVAFEPHSLHLCPLDVQLILESDKFKKATRIWESGGVVDVTEISENSMNTSIASGCLALCGLRSYNDLFQREPQVMTYFTGTALCWLFQRRTFLLGFCQRLTQKNFSLSI